MTTTPPVGSSHTTADTPTPAGCYQPLVREPLSPTQALALAQQFKAMGDPVRVRLLSLIASHQDGEACVCDLVGVFDLTGPTISHHLKVLRQARLITGQRRGTWVYYRIQPDALRQLSDLLHRDDRPEPDTNPRRAIARNPTLSGHPHPPGDPL